MTSGDEPWSTTSQTDKRNFLKGTALLGAAAAGMSANLAPGVAMSRTGDGAAAPGLGTANHPALTHKKVTVEGLNMHYVKVGRGPVVLCMHGWPQNHREFLPVFEGLTDRYAFIAPDLRGFADSDKPYDGYEPKTIARDMLDLLAAEKVDRFHILSHDLGGPLRSRWPTWQVTERSRSQRLRRHFLV